MRPANFVERRPTARRGLVACCASAASRRGCRGARGDDGAPAATGSSTTRLTSAARARRTRTCRRSTLGFINGQGGPAELQLPAGDAA